MWKEYIEWREKGKDGLNGGVQFIKVYRLQWKGRGGRWIHTEVRRTRQYCSLEASWGNSAEAIYRETSTVDSTSPSNVLITLCGWWSRYDSERFLFVLDYANITHQIKVSVMSKFWSSFGDKTLTSVQVSRQLGILVTFRYRATSQTSPSILKVQENKQILFIFCCLVFSVLFGGAINIYYYAV
jgi:hypothetical protein